MKMTIDQYRALETNHARKALCRKAGLHPSTIRMRANNENGEFSEAEQEALGRAMLPYVHVDEIKPLLVSAHRLLRSWESRRLSKDEKDFNEALTSLFQEISG